MKEAIQLQLTRPCHENWNAMTTNEQGRYCRLCCKTVVDFSIMTDREIMDYISRNAGGDTCARVQDSQLSRLIERPRERTASWKYFWSVALSSLLLSYRSLAQQVKPPKSKTVNMGVNPGKSGEPVTIHLGAMAFKRVEAAPVYELHGRVVNENNEPVAYASVTVNNTMMGIAADSAGNFVVQLPADISNLHYSVSSVGYESHVSDLLEAKSIKAIEVQKNLVKIDIGDVMLKQQVLKEVVVTAYGTTTERITMGAIGFVRRYTAVKKIKDSLDTFIVKRDIKIYPNPAPAGGSFNVQFNVKEAGEYNLEFIDASGRIVTGKQLNIVATGQVETFTAAGLQGHGIYFIRVAGRKDGKVYNTKLEVL